MAKLFGIFCASGLTQQHDFIVNKLKSQKSKSSDAQYNDIQEHTIYMATLDYKTFGPSAFLQTDSHIASLVGHPLLSADRNTDLNTLNKNYTNATLKECEGVFCMARFNKHTPLLDLATDALGIRPFYYMHYEGAFIFSTQYSLLKELGVPLSSNHEGMMEYATLGYYLFEHTHYNEISCINPGTRVEVSSSGITKTQYFDWCSLTKNNHSYDKILEGLKQDLSNNVDKYLANDQHVLTTLSGGLDSRLIACLLKKRNLKISALNFSQHKTQDLYCATLFAQDQKIDLDVIKVNDTQAKTIEDRLGKHWLNGAHSDYEKVTRSRLAWSGNGGSVGLGVIYYSDKVYEAALSQDVERLADAYLSQQFAYIPKSIIHNAEKMQTKLKTNIVLSLKEFGDIPLEKAYYLFLLLNDQHHHLAIPFDKVDDYQMDFCLPFYSWKVLRHVLCQPISNVRKHRFYHDFLRYAFPEALNTPWQAYPGHIPCTLPTEGIDQWQIKRPKQFNSTAVYSLFNRLISSQHKKLVNIPSFSAVALLHSSGIKTYNDKLKVIENILKW
ncbi:asparagine synthase [Pseudoalteromonas sp. BSi20652]|uniref:asparagine synthase-related protein n=1 Tax=Pseudoalteromonas sp. BSi20652 TaxID=388384 RepID=UPI0002319659|nr:asparagine synthase-related protein [Pseudoalteromonas sp. BSi20652]GAA59450.1 asparagine synthase [Pseudoalteromonas sp. BSi20652]